MARKPSPKSIREKFDPWRYLESEKRHEEMKDRLKKEFAMITIPKFNLPFSTIPIGIFIIESKFQQAVKKVLGM